MNCGEVPSPQVNNNWGRADLLHGKTNDAEGPQNNLGLGLLWGVVTTVSVGVAAVLSGSRHASWNITQLSSYTAIREARFSGLTFKLGL